MVLQTKCFWCKRELSLNESAHFIVHSSLSDLLTTKVTELVEDVAALCPDCYEKMICATAALSVSENMQQTEEPAAEEPVDEETKAEEPKAEESTDEKTEFEFVREIVPGVHGAFTVHGTRPNPKLMDAVSTESELSSDVTQSAKTVKKRSKEAFTPEVANEVLVQRASGIPSKELAVKYGVHFTTVNRLVTKYNSSPWEITGHGILEIKSDRGRKSHAKASASEEKQEAVEAATEPAVLPEQAQEAAEVITEPAELPKQKQEPIIEEEPINPLQIISKAVSAEEEDLSVKQKVLAMNAKHKPPHLIAAALGISNATVNKILESHYNKTYDMLDAKYNIKCTAKIYTLHKARWNPDLIASEVHLDTPLVLKVIKEFRNV